MKGKKEKLNNDCVELIKELRINIENQQAEFITVRRKSLKLVLDHLRHTYIDLIKMKVGEPKRCLKIMRKK